MNVNDNRLNLTLDELGSVDPELIYPVTVQVPMQYNSS
jgi:hypothetical protein